MIKKFLSVLIMGMIMLSFTACMNMKSVYKAPDSTLPIKSNSSFVQNNRVYLINETGDGWENVTPEAIPAGEMIFNVLFIDRKNGWAVGGNTEGSTHVTFYRTRNGGDGWEVSSVNGVDTTGWADMDFIDKEYGWLLVHQGAAMMHEGVALLRTEDGGASWETVSEAKPQQDRDGNIPFAGDKAGISFQTPERGWLTGYEPVSGFIYLYLTQDGGKTWNEKKVQVPDKYKNVEFACMPPLVFSDKDMLLPLKEGSNLVFYSTGDGGNHWSPGSWVTSSGEGASFLYSFYDREHGFAADGGAMFATSDGGLTWKKTVLGMKLESMEFQKMIFTGEKAGWLIGKEKGILKTADGGATWKG